MHAGLVDVRALLGALRGLGVRSLMVEGGARVIRSFLHAARGEGEGESVAAGAGAGESAGRRRPVVDALVVTVAPTVVGDAGVGYGAGLCAQDVSRSLGWQVLSRRARGGRAR